MYQSLIKGISVVALSFLGSWCLAQTGASSAPLSETVNNPYSKYGLGEIWNNNTVELRGMGNVTSAYTDPYQVNPDNPATYASLQRVTIDGGILASERNFVNPLYGYTTGTISFDYFCIAMPAGKTGGFSFGLRPYSKVYYSLVDTVFNSPIGAAERVYGGQGSLNYAYMGIAKRLNKLSLGINLGYLFGTLENATSVIPVDTASINTYGTYVSNYSNYTRIGGILWKAGAIYETKLSNSDYRLRIGATLTLKQYLREHFTPYQISSKNLGDTVINDTIFKPGEINGRLTMPLSYSIGAMLAKSDVWSVGIDYNATQWNTYNSAVDTARNLNIGSLAYKLALGGEYSPAFTSVHKHLAKVSYRFGFYYGTDYLNIQGVQLPVYGITFGGSLHYKATHFAWVNLHSSLDIGRLGTQQNNLIEQTYIKFTIGLSFNDKWFIPRKYD